MTPKGLRHGTRILLPALVVLGLLCGCGPSEEEQAAQRAADESAARAALQAERAAAARDVVALADDYVIAYFDRHPEQAPVSGAPDPAPDRLTDNSLEALARWQILEQDLLARLDAIPGEAITAPAARITADLLRHQLESNINRAVCRQELWHISPTWTGWLAEFTVLADKLRMETAEEHIDTLNRISQMADYVDTEIVNLREGVELGYTAPANSVAAVVGQLDAFLGLPVEETPFMVAAANADIGFRGRLAVTLENEVLPAFARYRDYLAETYAPSARETIGVDANPNGAACYRASVRYWATVELGPEEIHRIGLEHMERVMAELSEIGARSFDEPDPLKLLQLVKTDPQYLFTGRADMVAYAQAALARAKAVLPDWFGRVPEAPVIVEPYPEFQERTAPLGQAVPAAPDGSSPGKYLINTYRAESQSKAGLEATAFHEAYPGHHTQFTIAQERTDLHDISRYFYLSGFGEGWALYTERLADEMGLYGTDLDRVGMLSNEAWRAARLVVDSGIHGLGWSRQRALDYLNAHTANSRAGNAAEIDRYIAVPGQATSYLLGALEIRRQRERAEAALGEDFDIRAFHDRVLEDGAVPLNRLQAKIDAWVADREASMGAAETGAR
ncbi:DUF885 domain-containing protein [Elongatibacter sediminis]|uniref:DUF885 domain-containing protein n=1 Tax=Elongatibacter sediminis TaxID=3119006 RepID=A0AAW9RE10_9GAMM